MNTISFDRFLTCAFLAISTGLFIFWVYSVIGEIVETSTQSIAESIEYFVFLCIGIALFYGSVIYMLTRYGRLRRAEHTVHPSVEQLDTFFYADGTYKTPQLTILIPSYKEELRIIEMTLLSAALQEYPEKRIVLLVDDPVSYAQEADQELLARTLELPKMIEAEMREIHEHARLALLAFEERCSSVSFDLLREIHALTEVFEYQQQWFEKRMHAFMPQNHAEHFFVDLKFVQGRDRLQYTLDAVYALQSAKDPVTWDVLALYYRKACATFNVTISAFQRKRYENLSHEPNKAMNLNSYIGLIGKTWKEEVRNEKRYLNEVEADGDLVVPAAQYLITLDADSILSDSYARRLIYFMEQPGHERIAVAQTPYNTFRCPFIDLERIAGATTDIQHNVHQGFEYYHASFWVGANALLRTVALDDIKEVDTERGHTIYRFVQDRTVIEDTESSIDLVVRGWEVFNYHEQLAYSATPPDFGSFIIQRRRWANGGIIIFPKLVSYVCTGAAPLRRRLVEFFVRTHYLLSTAVVNVGVLAMILYPFDGELHIAPLMTVALLYFTLYARDLMQMGYSFLDLFRVYALNLLLIPVNIAGTLKSLQQLIFNSKIPFGRTPKVDGRTAASVGFIVAEFGLTIYMLVAVWFDLMAGRYAHAIFSAVNALFFLYACTRFIGWRAAYEDVRTGLQLRK